MKDRKFDSMHAAHNSFLDVEFDFNGRRRETEVASAKLSLRYLDTYQRD